MAMGKAVNHTGPYILFFSHSPQIRWYASVASELVRRGRGSAVMWVIGEKDRELAEALRSFDRVVNLLEGIDFSVAAREFPANRDYLAGLEQSVGSLIYHEAVAIDRHLAKHMWPDDKIAHYAVHLLRAMERELEALGGGPYLAFGENNTLPYRLAHYLLGKATPYWNFTVVRHWDHRFYLSNWQNEQWESCRRLYTLYGEHIPATTQALAAEKLASLREHRLQPFYMSSTARGTDSITLKISTPRLKRVLSHLWDEIRSRRSVVDPRAPTLWEASPIHKLARTAREIARKRYFDSVASANLPEDEAFASYFLHVQPEYSVEGLAFEFRDQLALIQNIAALIPANVRLLVKEHKPMLGRRETKFYRKLKQTPNVLLLSDRINSYDLIRKSKVIFTLTGTAALEAVYEGVPAVVLGDIYFDRFEGVYKATSIAELKMIVWNLLSEHDRKTSATAGLRTLAAMFDASYPGKISAAYDIKTMQETGNINLVVDAIEKEVAVQGVDPI